MGLPNYEAVYRGYEIPKLTRRYTICHAVRDTAAAFRDRRGRKPLYCLLNPGIKGAPDTIDGIRIKTRDWVPLGLMWLGDEA